MKTFKKFLWFTWLGLTFFSYFTDNIELMVWAVLLFYPSGVYYVTKNVFDL